MLTLKRLKTGALFVFLICMTLLSGCAHPSVSVWGSQAKTILPPGNACTNQKGGEVSITVPGAGKIIVSAQAMIGLKSHTAGQIDMAMLHIGEGPRDCTSYEPFQGYTLIGFSIPEDESSWTASSARLIPAALSRTFFVKNAGTKTYYLNGRSVAGNSVVKIWSSSLQAVYYPD